MNLPAASPEYQVNDMTSRWWPVSAMRRRAWSGVFGPSQASRANTLHVSLPNHKKLSFVLSDQTLADPPLTTQYTCVTLSQENGQDFQEYLVMNRLVLLIIWKHERV